MVKRWWFLGGLWLALVLAGGADAAAQATAEGQSIGRPSTEALASARGKESAIRDAKGPDSVTLTPNEMASLVKANLDLSAKRALDSIRIRLQPGRLAIDAYLVTSIMGTEFLGPIALMLQPLEPMTVAGPARAIKAGLMAWQPDSFTIRSFAFPQTTIPRLVQQLTGTADGTIPIVVPPTVRQIRIQPNGVTFSRRAG